MVTPKCTVLEAELRTCMDALNLINYKLIKCTKYNIATNVTLYNIQMNRRKNLSIMPSILVECTYIKGLHFTNYNFMHLYNFY